MAAAFFGDPPAISDAHQFAQRTALSIDPGLSHALPQPDHRTGLTHGESEMINSVKSILAATALVLTVAAPGLVAHANAETAADGVITVKSDYSVAETVARIKRDVARKGITFFGVIDQAKLGNAAGNVVRPSRLVMFGNPALGTTFITANPKAGLDWPVRVVVYQNEDGSVYAAYTDFDYIARRHGIENRAKEFKMATEVIQSVTSSIKK